MKTGFFVMVVALLPVAGFSAKPEQPAPAEKSALGSKLPKFIVDSDPRVLVPTSVDRIGRVWVPVFINDKGPFRMALDTGSDASAVLPRVVRKLGLSISHNEIVHVHGVTGSSRVPTITVDSVKVGDLDLGKMKLPVLDDAFEGADGILGTRGWGEMQIFLDFEKDRFHIKRSEGKGAPASFSPVSISLKRNLLIEFDVKIGGIPTKAVFDSGAQRTIGNLKLRDALLGESKLGNEENIVGITLDVTRGRNMLTPSIEFGDIEVHNVTVAFGDVYIFRKWKLTQTPAILLGMDVIASMQAVFIDYKEQKLHLKVPKKARRLITTGTRLPDV